MTKYDLVIITGPTASGKTAVAANLAYKTDGEVISADSRQVYRGMDTGTGKDYGDYLVNGIRIPVHMIDIVDPGYKYNVFEYQRDFLRVYQELKIRNKFPVVCGGSGMYIDSIVSRYRLIEVPPDYNLRNELENKTKEELTGILKSSKKLHNVTDLDTKKRIIRAIEIEKYYNTNTDRTEMPAIHPLIIGIQTDRDSRRTNISGRLRKRLEDGMVEEVQKLLDNGISPETLIYYGLEYKYVTLYITGKATYEEMFKSLEIAIHQYAKRQMTWFRGMERKGVKINWIDASVPLEGKISAILDFLNKTQ